MNTTTQRIQYYLLVLLSIFLFLNPQIAYLLAIFLLDPFLLSDDPSSIFFTAGSALIVTLFIVIQNIPIYFLAAALIKHFYINKKRPIVTFDNAVILAFSIPTILIVFLYLSFVFATIIELIFNYSIWDGLFIPMPFDH